MDRCIIVFDLDEDLLKTSYGSSSWSNVYADLQCLLSRHRFNNIQGTVYLSELGVLQAHATLALQEVATRYPWFAKCATNVHFYDVADDFNAQFIIDGITQARMAFDHRIFELRQQLIDADLPLDKVDEIIGKHSFSLENAPSS